MGKIAVVGGAVLLGAGLGAIAAGKTKRGARGPQGPQGPEGPEGEVGPDGPAPGEVTDSTLTFMFEDRGTPAGTTWIGIVVTPHQEVLVTTTLSPAGTTTDTLTVMNAPEGAYYMTMFVTNFVAATESMRVYVETDGAQQSLFNLIGPNVTISADHHQVTGIFEHPTDPSFF